MSVVDEEQSVSVYPVFNKKGVQVETVTDGYYIDIDTDEACMEVLQKIRSSPAMSKDDLALIDVCVKTVSAPVGSTTSYGPGEVLGMLHLAEAHRDLRHEIRACAHHIMHSLNFQMSDIDSAAAVKIFETAFKGHLALANAFSDAVTAGSMQFGDSEDETLTDDDMLSDEDDAVPSDSVSSDDE